MPYYFVRPPLSNLYWQNWNNAYWQNQNFGYWQNNNGGGNNRYLFSYNLSSGQSQLLNYSGNFPIVTGYQIFSGVSGQLGTVYTASITDFDPSYPNFAFSSSNTDIATISPNGGNTTFINTGNFTLTINNEGVVRQTTDLNNKLTNSGYNIFSGFVAGSLGNSIQTSFLSGVSGKTPSVAKPIFSYFDDSTATYIRNTGCWAYDFDLTPAPIYCDMGGASYGALVTPRHLICAWHAAIPSGASLRFVTKNNVVITRTVKGRAFMTGASVFQDLTICALDSDLPTGTTGINFCKVLPNNFSGFVRPCYNATMNSYENLYLPIIQLDKSYNALIKTFKLQTTLNPGAQFNTPPYPFSQYYEGASGGDSGSPSMLFISGNPVLLTVDTFQGGGDGTPTFYNKFQLNWMIASADLQAFGSYTNYTVTDMEITGFLFS